MANRKCIAKVPRTKAKNHAMVPENLLPSCPKTQLPARFQAPFS